MGFLTSLLNALEREAVKSHDKFESSYEKAQDMSDSQLMGRFNRETDTFKKMGYTTEIKRRQENE